MRAEVYLENERYFQACRAEPQLKIVESEEENSSCDVKKNDEDSFHEAAPLLATAEHEAPMDKGLAKEVNTAAEDLSDNEEIFEEALSTMPVEDLPKAVNVDALPPPVDPFLLVVTESQSLELALPPSDGGNKAPVSPRELLATLEEIKHSFRAQLEPEQSLASSPMRSKAQHSKGRAPPPPLPPRRDSSRDSTGSTRSGIGQLFKTIKDNVMRASSSSKASPDEEQSGARETSI